LEDTLSTVYLLAPLFEDTHGLVVQGHVTRLPTLRDRALDRQELTIEVDASPAQCKDLAASKSGVH